MQNLYYTPSESILNLVNQGDQTLYWDNISNVGVDSSSFQIVAYSGSEKIAYFPVASTNLYYPPFPGFSINQTVPNFTGSYINWRFETNFETSSNLALLFSGSLSNFFVSTSNSSEGSTTLDGVPGYHGFLLYANSTGSYSGVTSSLVIRDVTNATYLFSQSFIDTAITTSQFIQSSSQYDVLYKLEFYTLAP